ncbi:hypothetical protein ACQEVY_10745 [Streptomyces sp. CA-288835]|uniref:hypothetical protein n=1 Tax=Streptomyces sp. CA-288835 TaxID=3240069 RepID=UPI003D8E703E
MRTPLLSGVNRVLPGGAKGGPAAKPAGTPPSTRAHPALHQQGPLDGGRTGDDVPAE